MSKGKITRQELSEELNKEIDEIKEELNKEIDEIKEDISSIPIIQSDTLVLKDGTIAMNNLTVGSRLTGEIVGLNSVAEGLDTVATGSYSHAEGYASQATGEASHAEGGATSAIGANSHAEGTETTSSGTASHAEGSSTIASGDYSHAGGYETTASGEGSHAEGYRTAVYGDYSHVEGVNSVVINGYHSAKAYTEGWQGDSNKIFISNASTLFAVGDSVYFLQNGKQDIVEVVTTTYINVSNPSKTIPLYSNENNFNVIKIGTNSDLTASHAEGKSCMVFSNGAHAEGIGTVASGIGSHSEGAETTASGNYSHAQGYRTIASGESSYAEGNITKATAKGSHAEGTETTASGNYSHTEGASTIASGSCSHAEGTGSHATGSYSHAEGSNTRASGYASHAQGQGTTASVYTSSVMGQWNKTLVGSPTSFATSNTALVIGNGVNPQLASNAFRVMCDGASYGMSAFNSTGADYAEYFEWLDGNLNNEDRVGFVVTMEGDKIRKANEDDSYILGIISANPSVIGDSYQDDWVGRYLLDEWGRIQNHYVDVEYKELDENREEIIVVKKEYHPIYNPNWDSSTEYIPREQRKEWDAVGLVGKLYVRDDGTCLVNGFAKVGEIDGELTVSDEITNIRVMERVSSNIIRVFVK